MSSSLGLPGHQPGPQPRASDERFSIDGSDSDASDVTGAGAEDYDSDEADEVSPGDAARRAHKHKMLALSELMRVTTTDPLPEFDDEGAEAAVISSTRAVPGACVSGLPGLLVFLQGRDTAGPRHAQEP